MGRVLHVWGSQSFPFKTLKMDFLQLLIDSTPHQKQPQTWNKQTFSHLYRFQPFNFDIFHFLTQTKHDNKRTTFCPRSRVHRIHQQTRHTRRNHQRTNEEPTSQSRQTMEPRTPNPSNNNRTSRQNRQNMVYRKWQDLQNITRNCGTSLISHV